MNQTTQTSETTQEMHYVLIINRGGTYTIEPRTLKAARGDQVTFVAVGAEADVTLFFPHPELFVDQKDTVTLSPSEDSATLTVGSVDHNVYPYTVYSEERRDFLVFSPFHSFPDKCCAPTLQTMSLSRGPVIIIYNDVD